MSEIDANETPKVVKQTPLLVRSTEPFLCPGANPDKSALPPEKRFPVQIHTYSNRTIRVACPYLVSPVSRKTDEVIGFYCAAAPKTPIKDFKQYIRTQIETKEQLTDEEIEDILDQGFAPYPFKYPQ